MIIETFGRKRFEFIELGFLQYCSQRRDFFDEFKRHLPFYGQLKNFGDLRDLRVLTKGIIVDVTRDSSEFIQVKFKPGFITDLASTPRIIRGIIDNDDPVMLNAVLMHDYGFSTHYRSFREVNLLFKEMLLESGYSRFKTQLAYMAVNSIFARRRWNKSLKRKSYTLETTERCDDGRK